MLKVLAIVPCAHIFGLQIMTLRFFERLSGRVNSHFLITRWTDGEFSRCLDKLGIPYTYSWLGMISRKLDRVNMDMTIACVKKLPVLYQDFKRLVRFYRPDLIYLAGYHEAILLWPVLIAIRVPVVFHVHNPLPTGPFYRVSFFFWSMAINHYIGVSDNVRSSITKLGIEEKRLSLLYNGIDASHFECVKRRSGYLAAKYRWPDGCVIVGMTGQMNEAKGHLDFLEAACRISREHPELRFVIGGREEQPFFRRLKERIAKGKLDDLVAFSGWQDDMRSFYAGIDIFVLPTRQNTEGLPLVVAEAMATGLPVVATRSGGAVEIVEDGITGILVDRQSPGQLAEAIGALVKSPDTKVCMGGAGRRRVEQFFDLSKQAAHLQAILESVAASHKEC